MLKYVPILLVIACAVAYIGWRFLRTTNQLEGVHSGVSLYNLSFAAIDGKTISLKQFQGKKILFINVASECGYTPQYEDIEKLYRMHTDRLVIIGFPANDFGSQEPGTNEQIAAFCTSKYNVTFPLAQKSLVIGEKKNPIYRWLTDKSQNGWNDVEPKWNFAKYLVSADGELLKVYPSKTKPLDADLIDQIMR